jgi:hypothetical protein
MIVCFAMAKAKIAVTLDTELLLLEMEKVCAISVVRGSHFVGTSPAYVEPERPSSDESPPHATTISPGRHTRTSLYPYYP